MSQTNDSSAPARPSGPEGSGSEPLNIEGLQPQVLYDLNQQALERTLSDGPLVHDIAPLSILRSEYEANDNHVFVKEIDWLIEHGYKDFRRVKGDGDCFYRAIGFAFFVQLLANPDSEMAVVTTLSTLTATRQLLNETGVQELVYEDFYDQMVALTENIINPDPTTGSVLTLEKLLKFFRDPQESNTIVMYLRLITAAQIQANVDEYEFFLFHPDTREPMSVPDFCNRVMGLGKEADHVEIKALCDALRWNVQVAYLGGQSKDEVNFVKIPDTPYPGFDPVVLLYRPGHYDILLK
ncbi:cysteine proteinase [Macrolepiota fuliginosa MF-IS2]|uniref:ubiquitinyl hydrolase 1 n=1 Tax=Macrolepiota fuliginosa MF-IS2 TaxID=1400762 RepID=A0A9P6C1X4_9AGAR|nr:cysteine proteinase [Macrolepiota fuliginosa MF-IS2]